MKLKPIQLDGLKTTALSGRKSKVDHTMFGKPWKTGGGFADFLESLPSILGAADLLEIADRVAAAVKAKRTVILAMGAHPIKVGLSPVIIDLMERGVISGLATNGACVIHDSEVALQGRTSEDVEAGLERGDFGMAEETARFINEAIQSGHKAGKGLGRSVGEALLERELPLNGASILAQAARLDIPVTVHVAIGTDIIHFHPSFDGEAVGGASHLDFRYFCSLVAALKNGAFINLGSAVILPEVFLKALTLTHNLGYDNHEFTTVNMDFIRSYRPMTNVVQRPTMKSGKGFHLTGHHEIMFPLLAAAIVERLE